MNTQQDDHWQVIRSEILQGMHALGRTLILDAVEELAKSVTMGGERPSVRDSAGHWSQLTEPQFWGVIGFLRGLDRSGLQRLAIAKAQSDGVSWLQEKDHAQGTLDNWESVTFDNHRGDGDAYKKGPQPVNPTPESSGATGAGANGSPTPQETSAWMKPCAFRPAVPLTVSPGGGVLVGDLPCGHPAKDVDAVKGRAYCPHCWNGE